MTLGFDSQSSNPILFLFATLMIDRKFYLTLYDEPGQEKIRLDDPIR